MFVLRPFLIRVCNSPSVPVRGYFGLLFKNLYLLTFVCVKSSHLRLFILMISRLFEYFHKNLTVLRVLLFPLVCILLGLFPGLLSYLLDVW